MEQNSDTLEARAAFVKLIKEENFYSDSKQSLKTHWAGPLGGFSDSLIQRRWRYFLEGWQAARRSIRETDVSKEESA